MRQPNHNFATQNKACVTITSQLYDRRALDGPLPTLPLVSSLTHLSFLTSTSPRIREILTLDGGLERLVSLVAASLDAAAKASAPNAPTPNDLLAVSQGGPFRSFASYSKKSRINNAAASENQFMATKGSASYSRSLLITYTLSIQALCNVGVRGTEPVRTRVVEAGVLKVAARVLKSFLEERDRKAGELADKVKQQFRALRSTTWESGNTATFSVNSSVSDILSIDQLRPSTSSSNVSLSVPSSQPPSRTHSPDAQMQPSSSSSNVNLLFTHAVADDMAGSSDGDQEREEDELCEEPECDEMAAMQCRGRARSLTVKNASVGPSAPGSTDLRDAEMTDDLQAEGQAMDLDDVETVVGSHSIVHDASHTSPIREDIILHSPVPTYPLSISNSGLQPTNMSPVASTSTSTSQPEDGFRFREEEVLTCLQLLAYLSKYPHVRAVFHDPDSDYACSSFASAAEPPRAPTDKSNNIFSLVEKFTVRPAPGDRITPRLPADIQYWAGVIMRNACRKDDARDGIRQCANMLCGEWEKFPREFAKCRRCRKAKYCSKPCQSRAWQGGHRYWCSAKDGAEPQPSRSRGSQDRRESQSNGTTPRRRPRAMTDPRAANAAVVRAAASLMEGGPTTTPNITVEAFNEDDQDLDDGADQEEALVEIAGFGVNSDLFRRMEATPEAH